VVRWCTPDSFFGARGLAPPYPHRPPMRPTLGLCEPDESIRSLREIKVRLRRSQTEGYQLPQRSVALSVRVSPWEVP
jgi:hypothetical protein